jgi:hypothetical protein
LLGVKTVDHDQNPDGGILPTTILIQANWLRLFDTGRSATVRAWLAELRDTPADTGPALTLTAAWVAALTGNQVEMRRRLQILASTLDDSPLPDGTTSPQSALVLIRGMSGFDGPYQRLADAHRAAELRRLPERRHRRGTPEPDRCGPRRGRADDPGPGLGHARPSARPSKATCR